MDYFRYVDPIALLDRYPLGGDFSARFRSMKVDDLHEIRRQRLQEVLSLAGQFSFYTELWGSRSRDVEDFTKLPVFDKSDLMNDVARFPPFGSLYLESRTVVTSGTPVIQMTSGTTGTPQPIIFGPYGREAANVLLARMFLGLGIDSSDIVHSVYGHGLTNGGHYVREAVLHFTPAVFISAGTGVETASLKQVAMIRECRATVLVGFADYLLKLKQVGDEVYGGSSWRSSVRMIVGHVPPGLRERLETEWGGVPAYDWYGVADTGIVGCEGPERNGLWIWEDAHIVEILDESGAPIVEPHIEGDLVVTCLYKNDMAPVVRFNTHDRTSWLEQDPADELPFRRIKGFLGRSDNMVKLKGINVYPEALGGILTDVAGYLDDYYLRVWRDARGIDQAELVVGHDSQYGYDTSDYVGLIRARVGISIEVRIQELADVSRTTGSTTLQKPRRLLDER